MSAPRLTESTGLQILTGKGEWLWRPVSNRETLQISAFVDVNPRGFGLLQRSRAFDAFYDDETHWELQPSLWIEPIGDWGEGDLHLLEIPADSEINDNIVAYWRPRAGLAAGDDPVDRLSAVLVLVAAVEAAACVLRGDRGAARPATRQRFVVELAGDLFADPAKAAAASADVHGLSGKSSRAPFPL